MKKRNLIIVICLLILAACNPKTPGFIPNFKTIIPVIPSTENLFFFKDLKERTVLSKLYDNPIFIDSNKSVKWKPNFNEQMNMPTSFDGMIHTNIDTIMYFKNTLNVQCACMILTNYQYQVTENLNGEKTIEIGDCHFCGVPLGIALFEFDPEKGWELYAFKKSLLSFGYFGKYKSSGEDNCTISLKKIGDSWTCLSLREGLGCAQGNIFGSEKLISIEQYFIGGFPCSTLKLVFSYDYHDEYSPQYEGDENEKNKEISSIKFLKMKNDYYKIQLSQNKNGIHSKIYYSYSRDYENYIETNTNEEISK